MTSKHIERETEDVVTISKFRNNIKEYYEAVASGGETIFILRNSEAGTVMISKKRYNRLHKLENLLNTIEILEDEELISQLMQVKKDIKAGKWKKWKTFQEVTKKEL